MKIWVYFQVYSQEDRLQTKDIIENHIEVVAIIVGVINILLGNLALKVSSLNYQVDFQEVLLGAKTRL